MTTEDNLPDASNEPEQPIHNLEETDAINNKIKELIKAQEEQKNILIEILDSQNKMKEDIENVIQTLKTKKAFF